MRLLAGLFRTNYSVTYIIGYNTICIDLLRLLSNHFILVMVTMDLECIPGTMAMRQNYTLGVTRGIIDLHA